jgi:hypothetical protein
MATLVETMSMARPDPEEPMAWIENGRGPIARGVVSRLSAQGAHVRIDGDSSLEPGDDVDLRLSFDRDEPTLAATARVVFTQEAEEGADCELELEWTHSGPEREQLEALIDARS